MILPAFSKQGNNICTWWLKCTDLISHGQHLLQNLDNNLIGFLYYLSSFFVFDPKKHNDNKFLNINLSKYILFNLRVLLPKKAWRLEKTEFFTFENFPITSSEMIPKTYMRKNIISLHTGSQSLNVHVLVPLGLKGVTSNTQPTLSTAIFGSYILSIQSTCSFIYIEQIYSYGNKVFIDDKAVLLRYSHCFPSVTKLPTHQIYFKTVITYFLVKKWLLLS